MTVRRGVTPAAPPVRRVLLIDDDPEFQKFAKALLEKEGFVVTTLPDHGNAFAELAKEPYVLIVSDDNIEHMQGYCDGEVWCWNYKQQGGTVPVLLLTGAEFSQVPDVSRQRRAIAHLREQSGADFVIPKSVLNGQNGSSLFIQYAKGLALDVGTARSSDSNRRGL